MSKDYDTQLEESKERPGTDLYRRVLAYDYGDTETTELMEKVWHMTPWMVDCYTGGGNDRDREDLIRKWCIERFGPEAWPIHGKPGSWYRGNATIYGWTWMGFATQSMMEEFLAAWPSPVKHPGQLETTNG